MLFMIVNVQSNKIIFYSKVLYNKKDLISFCPLSVSQWDFTCNLQHLHDIILSFKIKLLEDRGCFCIASFQCCFLFCWCPVSIQCSMMKALDKLQIHFTHQSLPVWEQARPQPWALPASVLFLWLANRSLSQRIFPPFKQHWCYHQCLHPL